MTPYHARVLRAAKALIAHTAVAVILMACLRLVEDLFYFLTDHREPQIFRLHWPFDAFELVAVLVVFSHGLMEAVRLLRLAEDETPYARAEFRDLMPEWLFWPLFRKQSFFQLSSIIIIGILISGMAISAWLERSYPYHSPYLGMRYYGASLVFWTGIGFVLSSIMYISKNHTLDKEFVNWRSAAAVVSYYTSNIILLYELLLLGKLILKAL